MKKYFFNIILYVSIIFLIIFLYKYDYLNVKGINFSDRYLLLSVLFLFMGFIGYAFSWKKAALIHGNKISTKEAITSQGLSIFAKYIPGKVWIILGRASKISTNNVSLKAASFASLKEQLIFVWVGLMLSLFILIGSNQNANYVYIVIPIIVVLSVVNFSEWFRNFLVFAFKKIFKREFQIPLVKFKEALYLAGYVTTYWMFWNLGFYFFVKSFTVDIPISVIFIFSFSATLGLLALVVPGGLGVREGLIVVGLASFGIPLEL
ncbi:MAG TPA: lysylphosphatidylglycerol synthase domain-containing protein, partial [Draconibacterium sp.]|nr:lysylphosphatidylglycerol synthase domain-containing protein [Tenuifilaceae bacterium]HRX11057.1 lysylphosphatidylglycerol synthase domain-containing protein [Draconibacterium sp.]